MGADIHMKTYVYSKVENRYIDAYTLCDNLSIQMREYHYGEFPELVGERYYELFDLFGCTRNGTYDELKCLKQGIPEFVKTSTFYRTLDKDFGYFGFTWCYFPELRSELKEYAEKLKDPEKFLNHDTEIYEEWKKCGGNFTDPENKEMFEYIVEDNCSLTAEIERILDKLKYYDNIENSGIFSYDEQYGKLLDISKTIFMFWFDN